MATKTLLTVEQYAALDEPVGLPYELSEGELIVTPSASAFHNGCRDEFNSRLRTFVKEHKLGRVLSETDMMLAEDVVRRPDVAFIQPCLSLHPRQAGTGSPNHRGRGQIRRA